MKTAVRNWRARRAVPRVLVTCEGAQEAISAGLDGERSPYSRPTVDAHLKTCSACRDFAESSTRIARWASLRRPVPVPDGLVGSLLSALEPCASRPAPGAPVRDARAPLSWARTAQWAGAMVPAVIAGLALPLGVGSHTHIVPTRPPSPCTVGLIDHHDG